MPHDAHVNGKDLDAMSAVELAEELELIWGKMDEETYDEKIIDMYLDALDRKVPMPNHPDADTAYDLFLKARGFEPEKGRRRDFRFVLRAALAAVIAAALLFGAMVTVQAAGVDVFAK